MKHNFHHQHNFKGFPNSTITKTVINKKNHGDLYYIAMRHHFLAVSFIAVIPRKQKYKFIVDK